MKRAKRYFDSTASLFISYNLVGYMLNLLYVNLVFIRNPQKYYENLEFYSFTVGLCLWSSLTYFFLSFQLPYCKETRVLAIALLLMTLLYGIRMEDDQYNIFLQVILVISGLVIFFIRLIRRVLQNQNCKFTILISFLHVCVKYKFNCRKALHHYLEQQTNALKK